MNTETRYMLSRANLNGCADLMEETGHAARAITDLLRRDSGGQLDLNDFHRHGLLAALDVMMNQLSSRSEFAFGQLDKDFEGDDSCL